MRCFKLVKNFAKQILYFVAISEQIFLIKNSLIPENNCAKACTDYKNRTK